MNHITPINLQPEIFNLKAWIQLTDSKELSKLFTGILTNCGFNILTFTEHEFPLNGYTALWLLAESHLAVHTFNESGWSYIELSSCNQSKAKVFLENIKNSDYDINIDSDISDIRLNQETNSIL